MNKKFHINGQEVSVQDYKLDQDSVSFLLNEQKFQFQLVNRVGSEMIIQGSERFKAAIARANSEGESMVMAQGREAVISSGNKQIKKSRAHAGGLTSPMPGKIFKLIREVGEDVKKGDVILILEAMKMEHSIRADKDGKIKKILFKVGELVSGGVTLAEVE